MIIDIRGMNTSNFFKLNGVKFKFHSPYKTYPFNFDFIPKPLGYKLPNGNLKPFPNFNSVAVYPVYSDKTNEQIGFTMQHYPNYELEKQTPFAPPNVDFPKKLPQHFVPVDTFRFDTDIEYEHHSPKFLKTFINHLRNLSGQWWIGKIHVDSIGTSVSGIVQVNNTISNLKTASGMYTLKADFGKPITISMWKKTIEAMVNGSDFDVSRSLVLDAHYDLFSNNYRGVVLNLANALDITLNKFMNKYWLEKGKNDEEFNRNDFVKEFQSKNIWNSYIPGLISEFMKDLINRNYKEEFPEKYEVIRLFWLNKRTPVAHGSIISFELEEAFILLDTVSHCIKWTNEL